MITDNIYKLQALLRTLSDDQLAMYLKQPSPSVPAFAVMAELERRKQLRGVKGPAPAAGAPSTPTMPQAPVPQAQPMVQQAAQPQSAPADQGYAAGGLVAFKVGGNVPLPPATAAGAPQDGVQPQGTWTDDTPVPPVQPNPADQPLVSPADLQAFQQKLAQQQQPQGGTGLGAAMRVATGGGGDVGAYYKKFMGMNQSQPLDIDQVIADQQKLNKVLGYDNSAEVADLKQRQAELANRFAGGWKSPAASDAMLQAGLAMMAARDPNFLNTVGQGGLAGLAAYRQSKALANQDQRELDAETNRMQRNQVMDARNLFGIGANLRQYNLSEANADRRTAMGLAATQVNADKANALEQLRIAQMAKAMQGGAGQIAPLTPAQMQDLNQQVDNHPLVVNLKQQVQTFTKANDLQHAQQAYEKLQNVRATLQNQYMGGLGFYNKRGGFGPAVSPIGPQSGAIDLSR